MGVENCLFKLTKPVAFNTGLRQVTVQLVVYDVAYLV